jgi:predicted outer membrane protein
MLDSEKRLIERESSGIIDFLESKNKSSEKEINDLRNMSLFLVNTITEREEILSKEAETMRQEISNLAIGFDNREKDYIKETRDYSEKILSLHDLLTKAQERLEQGWDPLRSVSEAFRDQVETL